MRGYAVSTAATRIIGPCRPATRLRLGNSPQLDQHPQDGAAYGASVACPKKYPRIQSHAPHTGVPRETRRKNRCLRWTS